MTTSILLGDGAAAPPVSTDAILPPVDRKNLRRAAWAGGIGTALENFDFTIYGTASAIIFGKIFFPTLDPTVAIIASFGTLFVGFGARPLGGLFFSKYGDRLGRKFVMVATLFLMGTATFMVGLLPSYASVGILSPILLLMVRFLQGFGAGAEQASGIVLLTETAPKGKRGRYASLVFVGAAAGAAMAAVVWILVQRMSDEALLSYGWRLVFFSSIFVTIAAWIIRRKVKESPVFEELKVEGVVKKEVSPVGDVWKHGKRHLARIFFMNIGANAHSYIFQVFAGAYLINEIHIDAKWIPKFLLVGALCACVSAVTFGILSDKFGRRRMYLLTTGFLFLFAAPAFLLMASGNLVLIGVVMVIGFMVASQGTVGVQGAYFPELFGSRYRYAGVALGREFSSVFGGGLAPMICAALVKWSTGSWWPVAIYMMVIMAITFGTTFFAPETLDRDLLLEEDA